MAELKDILRGWKPQVEVQMQLVTDWLRPPLCHLTPMGPAGAKVKKTQSPCGKSILVGEAPTQNMTHTTLNSNQPTMELLYTKGHLTLQVASASVASHPPNLKE